MSPPWEETGVCRAMDGALEARRAQPPPAPSSEADAEPWGPSVSAGELKVRWGWGLGGQPECRNTLPPETRCHAVNTEEE